MILRFGFSTLDLHRLEAQVMVGNRRSERLLLRLGFAREGLLRDRGFWKGCFHDLTMFGRLRGGGELSDR